MGNTERSGKMKIKRGLAVLTGCAVLVFLPVSRAAAAETGAVKVTSEDGITVTLTTDKESYQAGEEIHYTLAIENGKALSYIKGADFTYSNTESLKPVSEEDMPASFPDIQPGEVCTISGVLVGDQAVFGEAADLEPAGEQGSGSVVVPVAAGIILLLVILGLAFLWLNKGKKGGGSAGRKAGTAAVILMLCMASEMLPVRAADADVIKLRPYIKFDYAGQEVMIRAVMEFRVLQKKWMISDSDRKQNKRITCHDPSVFKDFDGTYYVLGTHITGGSSQDLFDWTSLDKTIQEGYSQETKAAVKAWNDDDKAGSWNGYLWAPDIIYNTAMNKYCVYLSANGDYWKSNIVLLTADSVTGPYEYAGSIVYGGFDADNFSETDAPGVLGTDEIPERYVKNGVGNKKWGDMWPNCIDPCVFYDADGNLWMTYGSWSGGIFMLELDEETGLRDYSVSYDTDIHSDAYFGKKIAGGAYVSGEASYVQRIGEYYYLFISYGNLEAAGGYNVRVFRSRRPDGDYVDALGNSPYYDNYVFNYNQSVGVRLMGGYKWRNFNFGQVA